MDEDQLARAFHQGQTAGALAIKRLMGIIFDRQLSPTDVDGTFPTYSASALRTLRVGHLRSTQQAISYYQEARTAAGLSATLPKFTMPVLDEAAAVVSLWVTGPVTIKRKTGDGFTPD